ncbi:acetyltransferase [Alkalimonas mucilaginosa]|uniref:Acetyltransferase n=1 Tax=Alkalimonas mucilaginosa TaxID=3057676 RepID=A0ABU7JBE9_9GAMM|nr:acetyltransferase [Alkalimonas sp. MEB004]MEE2023026.1 acetyltransferase [Alkalimonas sp. MEB004]
MSKPVLLLGAGGHAAVLIDMLRQLNHHIIGLVAREEPAAKPGFAGIPFYASDDDVLAFNKSEVLLVNALGSLPGQNGRSTLQRRFQQAGYQFMTIVSPHSMVSEYAQLAEGVQVMPGAVINAHSSISEGSIINSGAIIEHDCKIGPYNHIAPGAVLSGGVATGHHVHVGTGANIIQSITIGNNVMISAGSTVVKSLPDNSRHYVARPYIC